MRTDKSFGKSKDRGFLDCMSIKRIPLFAFDLVVDVPVLAAVVAIVLLIVALLVAVGTQVVELAEAPDLGHPLFRVALGSHPDLGLFSSVCGLVAILTET